MGKELAPENGRISDFQGLVTLTLDGVILHNVMHHSSTPTYIPDFTELDLTQWFFIFANSKITNHYGHAPRPSKELIELCCVNLFSYFLHSQTLHNDVWWPRELMSAYGWLRPQGVSIHSVIQVQSMLNSFYKPRHVLFW